MDLALGADGDIDLLDGDFRLLEGADAVVQHLRCRLKLVLGEYFLDTRLGFPWFQIVFVKRPNLMLIRAAFRRLILSTPGIIALLELSLTLHGAERTLEVKARAVGIDGTIIPFTFDEPVLEAA